MHKLPAPFIAASIWFLSSQPLLPQPPGIFGSDKLQHVLVYAALAFTAGLWAPPHFWKRRPITALLLAALVSSAYGALDEVHQYHVPGRTCDIQDWLADTLGAFVGAAGMLVVMRLRCGNRRIQTKIKNDRD
ncbi:MAG: VanZ family protein [Treponema sp.]|nr:VanZ family protein [Treponema sp.]